MYQYLKKNSILKNNKFDKINKNLEFISKKFIYKKTYKQKNYK